MSNKKLIWIGVGAIALFLILRKKSNPTPIEEPKSSPLPLPLKDFNLSDPWSKRKPLPIIKPQPKKDSNSIPKNPYLDKTCDELREIRNNDMVSKIAPPTDAEELRKWELDRKYKEVAYQKCQF